MDLRLVIKIAALSVAIPSTLALVYYLFVREDNDEEEEEEGGQRSETAGRSKSPSKKTMIQVPVPSKAVGMVIGLKGSNIRRIQEESGAKVYFSSRERDRDEDRLLCIQGDSESAQRAEVMIRQAIAEIDARVTEEVLVPASCMGRLIGKKGESIRELSHTSRCKITIDKAQNSKGPEVPRVIVITGYTNDIQLAKTMIEEKVKEDEYFRSKVAGKKAEQEQRKGTGKQGPEEARERSPLKPNGGERSPLKPNGGERSPLKPNGGERSPLKPNGGERISPASNGGERISPIPRDGDNDGNSMAVAAASWDGGDQRGIGGNQRGIGIGQVPGADPLQGSEQVFVSAVENVGHFWLQRVNRQALNLDKLTDDMSQFYSSTDNNEKCRATNVKEGDVVAAPFSWDRLWYRARVEELENGKADLYFFDFGDNDQVSMDSVRELKPEFCSLPVQAVECSLANVKPTGEDWTEKSSTVFETLTHSANWKVLTAHVVGYLPLPTGPEPSVHLVDNEGPQPIDVATELVAQGLAVWENPPSSSSLPSSFAPPAAADTVPNTADTAASTADTAGNNADATDTVSSTAASNTVRPALLPDPQSS